MKSWMQTFTGNRYYPEEADRSTFVIEDIAHALSNLCRYGGHCREFYSVAEHSVLVADIVAAIPGSRLEDELLALMHDATEAYMIDLPTPIKALLPAYKIRENDLMLRLAAAFNLQLKDGDLPGIVHHADKVALVTEARQILNGDLTDWAPFTEVNPYPATIQHLAPAQARDAFLARYQDILTRIAAANQARTA